MTPSFERRKILLDNPHVDLYTWATIARTCVVSMKRSKRSRAGHVPLRTCVGCRQVREKKHLLRIVRSDDGTVAVDPEGKVLGRGAYVCPDPTCVALAHKRRALDRSLRVSVPDSVYLNLSTMVVRTHAAD